MTTGVNKIEEETNFGSQLYKSRFDNSMEADWLVLCLVHTHPNHLNVNWLTSLSMLWVSQTSCG